MEKITIERTIWINAPRERVWQAVTEAEQIAQWFSPGMTFSQKGDTISIHMGEMTIEVAVIEVVDPPRRITTRNLPDKLRTTTYLLEEENGGTRFTVIENGLETLPEAERQEHLDKNGQGWENVLKNLKAFMEGQASPNPAGF